MLGVTKNLANQKDFIRYHGKILHAYRRVLRAITRRAVERYCVTKGVV